MNNSIIPTFTPMMFDPNAINEETNKTLKQLFKGKMNGSFLIKIKSSVICELGINFLEYYHIHFDSARLVTGSDETPEYDICRIIFGIHRHHSIFLTKEEIRSNEKSEAYQNQLIEETIEKIKLRQCGSAFYRKKQLLVGDEFLYFPVPYELFVMCMKSIVLLSNSSNWLAINYGDIVNIALSALTLMENNFLSNAYPLCRGMIELYIKTLILQKHPEAEEAYSEFCRFEIEQSCCSQKYPDKFNKLYNQRKYQLSKSKVDYLHYGWLDSIVTYDSTTNSRYSIYGIFDYLMRESNDAQSDTLDDIKCLYKMCHGYTHGSAIHVKYPLLQYFEVSMMLYYVLRNIFPEICNASNIDLSNDDPNIMKILDRDFDILKNQYNIRSTENFDLYYELSNTQ
ncbi:MAG: hypothetical protein K2M73_04690 [Lachnospiraceae bacterium]|nr:hypothetical protein [Lachnospiraceae bacterium]